MSPEPGLKDPYTPRAGLPWESLRFSKNMKCRSIPRKIIMLLTDPSTQCKHTIVNIKHFSQVPRRNFFVFLTSSFLGFFSFSLCELRKSGYGSISAVKPVSQCTRRWLHHLASHMFGFGVYTLRKSRNMKMGPRKIPERCWVWKNLFSQAQHVTVLFPWLLWVLLECSWSCTSHLP